VDGQDVDVEGLGRQRRAKASPALNEGVGEHVRTRFHFELCSPWTLKPVKLQIVQIRTERRKSVSSAGPSFFKSELFSKLRSSRLT
jgi:hypothetical protein